MMRDSAKNIMSKNLITARMEDSMRTAFQMMQEKKIRHLPVVDTIGAIVGILSDRDVRRAMIPKAGIDSLVWPTDVEESRIEFDPKHKVSDFMSWPARTVSDGVSVLELAQTMLKEKLSALIVSGGDGRQPRGIVTTDDLLKCLVELLKDGPSGKPIRLDEIGYQQFN